MTSLNMKVIYKDNTEHVIKDIHFIEANTYSFDFGTYEPVPEHFNVGKGFNDDMGFIKTEKVKKIILWYGEEGIPS